MGVVELLSKVFAEQYGWSQSYAEGYAAGQALRRKGETIPSHAMVGIDERALGFRAGYFTRQSPASSEVPIAGISETAQNSPRTAG